MKSFVYFLLLALLAGPVMAHEGHGIHTTKPEAISIAKSTIKRLTEKDSGLGFGQLPASWANLPAESVKVHETGEDYYIVSATNTSEGKTLYVLISAEEGQAFDANFTGKFKDLAQ